jgi:hypothetical protein
MRCYCGHFFYQRAGSTSPTVPSNKRLVVIEESGGIRQHIGWFHEESGWWMMLDQERANGEKLPPGEWCSITIGNITGWREIIQHTTQPNTHPQQDLQYE